MLIENNIIPLAAVKDIIACTAFKDIPAITALKNVIASKASKVVVASASIKIIGVTTSSNSVVTCFAVEKICYPCIRFKRPLWRTRDEEGA